MKSALPARWLFLIPPLFACGEARKCETRYDAIKAWGEWITRASEVPPNQIIRIVLPCYDDWQTGGDWPGRYGRAAWVLCGMAGPWDYRGGPEIDKFTILPTLGENKAPGDGVRCWLHWPYLPEEVPKNLSGEQLEALRGPLGRLAPSNMDAWEWSDVRRVLINPVNGGRRQSSWDDHAEGYSPGSHAKDPIFT